MRHIEGIEEVCRYIREHVARPSKLPVSLNSSGNAMRFNVHGEYCCPLGMIEGAPSCVPDEGFADLTDDAVGEFADWWDAFTDQSYAVDAVWGSK